MKGRGARTIDADRVPGRSPPTRGPRTGSSSSTRSASPTRRGSTPRRSSASDAKQVSLEKLLGKAARLDITVDEAATLASRLARLDQE